MSQVVLVFGILFVLLGLAAAIRPAGLTRLARKLTVHTWLRIIAFVVRVGLGVILILAAPSTMFPLPARLIGVLLIVSGVIVLALGNRGVQRILDWALGFGAPAVVTGGIVGIAFGAFLIYLVL